MSLFRARTVAGHDCVRIGLVVLDVEICFGTDEGSKYIALSIITVGLTLFRISWRFAIGV